jgi:hypothetical protein
MRVLWALLCFIGLAIAQNSINSDLLTSYTWTGQGSPLCESAKSQNSIIIAKDKTLISETKAVLQDLGSSISSNGNIERLYCGKRVIGVQFKSASFDRLYFYDTTTLFNRQSFISTPSDLSKIYSPHFRGGVFMLSKYTQEGHLKLQYNPLTSNFFDAAKTVSLTIQAIVPPGTTSEPIMAFGESSDKLIIFAQNKFAVVSFDNQGKLTSSLTETLTAASSIDSVVAIIPETLDATVSDLIIGISGSNIYQFTLSSTGVLTQPSTAIAQADAFSITYAEGKAYITTFGSSKISLWDKHFTLVRQLDLAASSQYWGVNYANSKPQVVIYLPSESVIRSVTPQDCSQNCISCLSSTNCLSKCNPTYFLTNDGSCVTQSTTAGQGKNLVTFTIDDCKAQNCKNCADNYLVCSECIVIDPNNIKQYLLPGATLQENSCVQTIPNGYGINTQTTNNLAKCQDFNCLKCSEDFTKCSMCVDPYLAKKSNLDTCYLPTSIPPGWTRSPTEPGLLVQCADAGCTYCPDGPSACRSCSNGKKVQVFEPILNQACIEAPTTPIPGYGLDLASTWAEKPYVMCADNNCQDCSADNTICSACKAQTLALVTIYKSNFLLPSGSVICKVKSDFGVGFGVSDSTNSLFGHCSDTRCKSCTENVDDCVECKPESNSFVYLTNAKGACLTINEVKAKPTASDRLFGVKNGKFVPCPDNCLECYDNYDICTKCSSNYVLDRTNFPLITCKSSSSIPEGMGPLSTQDPTLVPCKDSLCKTCASDYQICTECQPKTYFVKLPITPSNEIPLTCYSATAIPDGWGRNLQTTFFELQQCIFDTNPATNCMKCSSDYSSCDSCKEGFILQPSPIKRKCLQLSELTPGWGLDKASSPLISKPCKVVGCITCQDDFEDCSKCDLNRYLDRVLKKTGAVSCPTKDELKSNPSYAGSGANNQAFTVEICSKSGCQLCPSDSSSCERCSDSPAILYLLALQDGTSSCQPLTFLDTHPGLGISTSGTNPIINSFVPCIDSNCYDCKTSYANCGKCKNGFYLWTDSSNKISCLDDSPTHLFPPLTGIDKQATIPKLATCSDINCAPNGCKADSSICLQCKDNFLIKGDLPSKPCTDKNTPGYGIDLANPAQMLPCSAGSMCQLCPTNYKKCEKCVDNLLLNTLTPDSPTNLCYSPTVSPAPINLGRQNPTSDQLVRCEQVTCDNCFNNMMKCVLCNSASYTDTISNPDKLICRSSVAGLIGAGFKADDKTVAKCTVQRCRKCDQYDLCTECEANYALLAASGANAAICYSKDALPETYGFTSANTVEKCQVDKCRVCREIENCISCLDEFVLVDNACKSCPSNCLTCSSEQQCTKCKQGYYLDSYSQPGQINCVLTSPGDGYWTNSVGMKIEKCEVGCATCNQMTGECLTCIPTFALFMDSNSKKGCKLEADLQSLSFGKDTTSTTPQLYRKCSKPNCQICISDFSSCEGCIVSSSQIFYFKEDTKECLSIDALTPGYGINPDEIGSVRKAYACDLNTVSSSKICVDCRQNYKRCAACAQDNSLQVLPDGQTKCIPSTQSPIGYGLDTATGTRRICEELRCKDCNDDFKQCKECYKGYFLLKAADSIDGKSKCLDVKDIPRRENGVKGFGIDFDALANGGSNAQSSTLVACLDQSICLDCSKDFRSCQKCDSSLYYYIARHQTFPSIDTVLFEILGNTEFVSCIKPTELLPASYGKNKDTAIKKVEACPLECSECLEDFSKCSFCKLTSYLSPDYRCLTEDQVRTTQSLGKDISSTGTLLTRSLKPCSIPGCLYCDQNSNTCRECVNGKYLHSSSPSSISCVEGSQLLNTGFGLDVLSSPKSTKTCQESKCKDCGADFNKCTVCKDNFWYFVDASGLATCLDDSQLADLKLPFGKQPNSFELKPCDPSCLSCKNLFTACDKCKDTNKYLIPSYTSNNCKAIAEVPIGFGLKDGVFIPCTVSECDNCATNADKCTKCAANFYLDSTATNPSWVCILVGQIPDGKGINKRSPDMMIIEPCALDTCLNCRGDIQVCLKCKPGLFEVPLVGGFSGQVESCLVNLDSFSKPFGKDGDNSLLKACSNGCKTCKDNYQVCSECLPGFYYYLTKCYAESDKPASGFGKDKTTVAYKYSPCKVQYCSECFDEFQICQTCRLGYNLKDNTCSAQTTQQEGVGKDLSTGLLAKCIETGCKYCIDDNSVCTECFTGFALSISTNEKPKCLDMYSIPEGSGIDGKSISSCTTANCQVCASNAKGCDFCKAGTYLYQTDTTTSCIEQVDIPQGFGPSGYKVATCSDMKCLECKTDSTVCGMCSPGYYISPIRGENKCIYKQVNLDPEVIKAAAKNDGVKRAELGTARGVGLVKFTVDVSKVKKDDLNVLAYDKYSGEFKDGVTLEEFNVQGDGKTIFIKFGSLNSLQKLNILLRSKYAEQNYQSATGYSQRLLQATSASASTNPFDNGVLIEDVEYYDSDSQGFIRGASLFFSIIFMVCAALLYFKDYSYFFRLIELAICIGMFNFWNSNIPVVFASIVYWFRLNLFNVIPFWSIPESYVKCTPSLFLFSEDYSCFNYNNLNRYIPTFLALALCYFVFGIWWQGYQRTVKEGQKKVVIVSDKNREIVSNNRNEFCGQRHLIDWLFTVMMPLVYHCSLNIFYANDSPSMKNGFAISIFVLAIYLCLILGSFLKLYMTDVSDQETFSPISYSLLADFDLCQPIPAKRKYARAVQLVRNLLIALILAFLCEAPLAQNSVVFIIFVIHYVYFVMAMPYDRRDKNKYSLAVETLLLVVVCLLLALCPQASNISVHTRQVKIGYVILLCVILIIFTGIYKTIHLLSMHFKRANDVARVVPKQIKT